MRNILFVASIAATTLQAALAKEAAAPQANVETPRPSFQKDAQAESNPSAPVPPKVEPNSKAKPSVKLLALHDLIVNALNKNLELKAKRLDPSIQLNRSAAAMGAFDPNWVLGYNFSETERAQNRRESLSAGGLKVLPVYEEHLQHAETGIAGRMTTGMQYQLLTQTDRIKNSFNIDSTYPYYPEFQSSTTLTLVQPLLKDFGQSANLAEVRLQRSALKASRFELEATILKVLRDVSTAYFEMVFAQENIRVKEEAVGVAEKLVSENTRRMEEGKMAPIDVTQAQGRVAEAKEELLLAKNFLAQRRNTLRELTSDTFDFDEVEFLVDSNFIAKEAPRVNRGEALATLFQRNPSYLASVEIANSEDIRISDARNQLKPRVDLKGTVGYNGLTGDFGSSYNDYSNRSHPTWSAGFVVSVPLGNHVAKSRLAEASNRKEQARFNQKRTEVTLLSAFDTALRDIANASERVSLVRDSVHLAKASAEAETLRLASGKTTSYNVSQTLRDLSQSSSRELASIVDLNKALIQLQFVLGTLPEHLRVDIK